MNLTDSVRLKLNDYGRNRTPFLFVFDFLMQKPLVFLLDEPILVYYDFRGKSNLYPKSEFTANSIFNRIPVSSEHYKTGFDCVMNHLRYGNSFLTNYTQPTQISTNLTLEEIYCQSTARYKLLVPDEFVFFSPETFITIDEAGIIRSFPMKGTIDASIPDAEHKILADSKEMAEHNTIVDLIRNDLSKVAKQVRVGRFRYIDYLKTRNKDLLQVSSEISGVLGLDYHQHIGDILLSLLPAGSVSGAPKKKTVEIILESERYERGYYTGVAGLYDGNSFDSTVMIRFIEKSGNNLIYKSGGGITVNSNAEKEYQELIDKVYVPFD
jgi:para-aminobenzoate synthetase component I